MALAPTQLNEVGAILAASATAFQVIKWFGVAYLVYLAYKQWRALPMDMSDESGVRPIGKPLSLVFRGFLVNISNPKALVFMLAVLPQFIDPHAPLVQQYLILGATMIVVDLTGDGRNDISMFEWAREGGGLAFAMGQGPDEVKAAATAVTASVEDDGVAQVLAAFEGILFTHDAR